MAQIGPDVFHWIEFRRIGRQGQQRNVGGNHELLSPLMPACSVTDEDGARPRRHLGADLLEMFVHSFRVGVGHDHGGADGARGTYGAEDVGRDVAIVANHPGAGADGRPDISMAALLTYASFVLKPDFDWMIDCDFRERGFDQVGEVFLKASSASGAFCG